MIATITGTPTAGITAIITNLQCNIDASTFAWKAKGGSRQAPPFCFSTVSSRKRARSTYVSRATRTAKAV